MDAPSPTSGSELQEIGYRNVSPTDPVSCTALFCAQEEKVFGDGQMLEDLTGGQVRQPSRDAILDPRAEEGIAELDARFPCLRSAQVLLKKQACAHTYARALAQAQALIPRFTRPARKEPTQRAHIPLAILQNLRNHVQLEVAISPEGNEGIPAADESPGRVESTGQNERTTREKRVEEERDRLEGEQVATKMTGSPQSLDNDGALQVADILSTAASEQGLSMADATPSASQSSLPAASTSPAHDVAAESVASTESLPEVLLPTEALHGEKLDSKGHEEAADAHNVKDTGGPAWKKLRVYSAVVGPDSENASRLSDTCASASSVQLPSVCGMQTGLIQHKTGKGANPEQASMQEEYCSHIGEGAQFAELTSAGMKKHRHGPGARERGAVEEAAQHDGAGLKCGAQDDQGVVGSAIGQPRGTAALTLEASLQQVKENSHAFLVGGSSLKQTGRGLESQKEVDREKEKDEGGEETRLGSEEMQDDEGRQSGRGPTGESWSRDSGQYEGRGKEMVRDAHEDGMFGVSSLPSSRQNQPFDCMSEQGEDLNAVLGTAVPKKLAGTQGVAEARSDMAEGANSGHAVKGDRKLGACTGGKTKRKATLVVSTTNVDTRACRLTKSRVTFAQFVAITSNIDEGVEQSRIVMVLDGS